MPHPPRIKISKQEAIMRGLHPVVEPHLQFPMDELPEPVREEVKEKIQRGEKHVQFRMPLDVWARMRARQFEMNRDAAELMAQNNLPMPSHAVDLVPMSEIIRKMFDEPLRVHDPEILGMIHKRGKGRLFR